jgi:hypothetical protein
MRYQNINNEKKSKQLFIINTVIIWKISLHLPTRISSVCFNQRDYRKGLPLLTVKTEVNGDSKSAQERSFILVVRRANCAGTRDYGSAF